MWMPRNRAGRGRQRVGGGGKGGRTVGGVRGAGNGRSKTAPSNRSMPPSNWPARSRSIIRCHGISISNFRIPNSVWGMGGRAGEGEGSDMARPMGGRTFDVR